MRKKLLWFYAFDFKSIIYTVLFIGFIVSLFYFSDYTTDKEPEFIKNYDSETYGKVYSIKKETTISQSETGHHTSTFAYTIKYSFIVDGISYNGKIMLKNKIGNLKHLSHIRENINRPVFKIKYLLADPEENYMMYSTE